MNNLKWTKFLITEQADPSIFEFNRNVIKRLYGFYFEEINIPSTSIFRTHKIGEKIGGGDYGQVYQLRDSNKVVKIYEDGVHLSNDIKRYRTVIKQVYSGKAKNVDMHYFEEGELGDGYNEYYYAVMPRIIPLEYSPFWHISGIFDKAAQANRSAIDYKTNINTFSLFRKEAQKRMLNSIIVYSYSDDQKHQLLNDYKKYKKTVNKIFKAGYEAYIRHNGKDLHAGNIGYLPQKPDIFFYFDM